MSLLFLGVAIGCIAQEAPRLKASQPLPLIDQSAKKATTLSVSSGAFAQSRNAPLYVVDGTPITEERMKTLEPNQIDNITILKDSKATAVYGPAGLNGVVLITMKK
nr:TonB-dependent receptor plug domain-containing protein [Hymenobacter sp. YC55]